MVQCRACLIDHRIDAAEVVKCLDHIIHIHRRIFKTDGIGLKDVPRLIVRQTAALNMVGVIG